VKETPPPPVKTRLRRLSPEEIELWLSVTKTISPRPGAALPPVHPPPKIEVPGDSSAPSTLVTVAPAPQALVPASNGPRAPAALAPLERRLRQRLARGQVAPDAAIDLHGMCRQEAFVALRSFLARAQQDGAKLVLVVTGKGERGRTLDGGEPGILRKSVPQWLHGPDYRSLVVGFEEASRTHGGTGALYVRIRRRDKTDR
jgi:DNA-nicking Smr family endonuclease